MDRLRAVVHGTVLMLIIGWVLYIGQTIFVPAVLGAVGVYVIVGLAHVLGRLPALGPRLPLQLRYLCSIVVIGLVFFLLAYLVMANEERALALVPPYQQSLLAVIQQIAVQFGFETEPTWATLRQELMAQINLQRLFAALLASVGSIVVTFVVVMLYASFLMIERRAFESKLARMSDDPAGVARIRGIIGTINRRIGSYLALKTLLSLLLGAVSWAVMALYGLQFAALWAVLAGFLRFVPYVGSVLGVVFPVLMAVEQFQEPGPILALLLALTAVQFVIGNFLDPLVMGDSLNLSPFAILAIVFSEFAGMRPVAVLLSQNGKV
jgi:predicted PurR-regulated permease PerM